LENSWKKFARFFQHASSSTKISIASPHIMYVQIKLKSPPVPLCEGKQWTRFRPDYIFWVVTTKDHYCRHRGEKKDFLNFPNIPIHLH
jgi:hypothetical protein